MSTQGEVDDDSRRLAGVKWSRLPAICLLAIVLLAGAGCTRGSQIQPPGGKPAILITYESDFAGETASGYLNLVVDLTIENTGYQSFSVSPSGFSVKVGEYAYDAAAGSQMNTVQLKNGGKVEGRLVFQVPPQAASPRTGFEIQSLEQKSYNIQWVRSPSGPATESIPPQREPVIDVLYRTDLMWLAAPGTQYLKVDPPGNLYLIVEMTIENRGYESFHTNPDDFSVEVTSQGVSVASEVEEELIDWRELNIPNSGTYTGTLAFRIPTEAAQSFYQWDYRMLHTGVRSYKVSFTKLRVSKTAVDGAETRLDAAYLRNGDSIKGRLAFEVSPDMASTNARYELLYDNETTHNVQFFDRPGASADVNRNPIAYPAIVVTYSTTAMEIEARDRLFVMVDLLIENKGYDSFLTSPGSFILEVSY